MREPSAMIEACRGWAVEGEIIQIARDRVLFRPRVATRPFLLTLDGNGEMEPAIGVARLIVLPAAYGCRRVPCRRGETPAPMTLGFHGDEIEQARGRLLARVEIPRLVIIDIGFPVVVEELTPCPELERAQLNDMIDLKLAPPTLARLL